MRRLLLALLTALGLLISIGVASASATATPSCIPTSNTPFTVTVPGITAFTQPDVGIVMAPLPDPSQISHGVLTNEMLTANGLTATATFPAGLASGVYGVVAPVAETEPQFISVGTITIGCGVIPHSTSTIVSCGTTPVAPAQSTLCTAVVTDTSSQPNTPTGTITLTSGAPATFTFNPCTTSTGGAGPTTGCAARVSSLAVGTQTITATYSGDSTHKASSGTALLTVVKPPDTGGCRVTFKGQLALPNGDLAHIAGNARGTGPTGHERYRDRGPANPLLLVSHAITAVPCPSTGGAASIFGTGSLGKGQTVSYRIDVTNGANATYRIRLSNGYDSGVAQLHRGSINITLG